MCIDLTMYDTAFVNAVSGTDWISKSHTGRIFHPSVAKETCQICTLHGLLGREIKHLVLLHCLVFKFNQSKYVGYVRNTEVNNSEKVHTLSFFIL